MTESIALSAIWQKSKLFDLSPLYLKCDCSNQEKQCYYNTLLQVSSALTNGGRLLNEEMVQFFGLAMKK